MSWISWEGFLGLELGCLLTKLSSHKVAPKECWRSKSSTQVGSRFFLQTSRGVYGALPSRPRSIISVVSSLSNALDLPSWYSRSRLVHVVILVAVFINVLPAGAIFIFIVLVWEIANFCIHRSEQLLSVLSQPLILVLLCLKQ